MIHKIEKLNDTDAVIISDKGINEHTKPCWYYNSTKSIWKESLLFIYEQSKLPSKYFVGLKEVVATISPFKIEGLPILELPSQEEDVEKLAKQEFPLLNTENDRTGEIEEENLQLLGHRRTFIKGYKAAQKQFSEDDMRKAISGTRKGMLYNKKYEDEYIRSLQKKQFPVAVDLECESIKLEGASCGKNNLCTYPNCLKIKKQYYDRG